LLGKGMRNLPKQVVNCFVGFSACLSPVFFRTQSTQIIRNHKIIYDCAGYSQIFFSQSAAFSSPILRREQPPLRPAYTLYIKD
ncbi:MAG: hypothetical protein IKN52_01400, partial [Victivallales bacterium]|nr:hypothetical protein [Victivallales bacterium]